MELKSPDPSTFSYNTLNLKGKGTELILRSVPSLMASKPANVSLATYRQKGLI